MNTFRETEPNPTRADLLALLAERERELAQTRAREAASSEILGVIARSPSDVQPVFQAILAASQSLFGSDETGIYTVGEDAMVRVAAWRGPRGAEVSGDVTPLAESVTGRILSERRTHHIPDLRADPTLSPKVRERVERLGSASLLYAPMLSQHRGFGSIVVVRSPPSPFSEREEALLQSFADQAAIAIENARLFHETKEALEAQTTTADILKVTAASPQDTQPVFDAIAASAKRLLHGHTGVVFRYAGGMLHVLAHTPVSPEADAAFEADYPRPLDAESLQPGEVVEIADTEAVESLRDLARARGYRSVARAPLISDGQIIGLVAVTRKQAGALPRRHVHLLQTFADQAVIAIRNARLFNETREALERQTATADVLRVISLSPTDPRPVFDNIVVTAVRLLRASLAAVHLRDGGEFFPATEATPQGLRAPILGKSPIDPNANFPSRAILGRQTLYVPDWSTAELPDDERVVREALGVNCGLYLPLLRQGECFGLLSVFAQAPDSFGPAELTLAESFRDQALIAVENARLFNETQEALQQQTATADVLKVISRSVFDLDTVLETLIDTAVRLARGSRGTIFLRQGDVLVARAFHRNVPDPIRAYLTTTTWPLDGDSQMAQAVREGRVVHIADLARSQLESDKATRARAAFGAGLWVPLMRDRQAIGVFGVPRDDPIAFSDREIELVQTFADQAVIAIENTRLFDEVQERTRDVTEALDRQTATSEILRVISQSPTDAGPVFESIVHTAARLLQCDFAFVMLTDGKCWWNAAGASPEGLLSDFVTGKLPVDRGANFPSRAILDKAIVYLPDWSAIDVPEHQRQVQTLYGVNASLHLPLLREGECIGVLTLTSRQTDPFGPQKIAQAESFRDQALIAMENARLFRETQEALQQQTATADVLKVISRSAFDLQAVFDTLVGSAVELIGALGGSICTREGENFVVKSALSADPAYNRLVGKKVPLDRSTMPGRGLLSEKIEVITDTLKDPEFVVRSSTIVFRSAVSVPLLREGRVEGVLTVAMAEPNAITQRHIDLVQTFADQAVIAIENSRLFEQVQARTRDLASSLDNLRKTQDRLIQSEKLASLGQLTAGIAHEIKNPLNFINNFSALSRELLGELREALGGAALDADRRDEVSELIGLLDGNLEKVVNHGQRADSIVKNMLLHSREGSGERTRVDINAMVEEALNLAYHGARAEKPGFNVTLQKALDPHAGFADLYGQEMARVLINLIANGFYATNKRKETEDATYQPTIRAATQDLGDRVAILIRDNGTGVTDEVKAKMFNPFFTTKPAGEGTGLGLSLSHDIVVKQHGGALLVESEPGSYTQFTILLPRASGPGTSS